MKPEYRRLRLNQLTQTLTPFGEAKRHIRPQKGWLRAIREALGITLEQVGHSIGTTRQRILGFEHAEAQDRITLRSLRKVARAMGCDLVYAVVPQSGTIKDLAEQRARSEATKRVLAVEHSMALENQASGNVQEKIEEETKRILKGE